MPHEHVVRDRRLEISRPPGNVMNDVRDSTRRTPESDLPKPATRVAGHYPVELETDFKVRGGATLHLRPIRSDDSAKLVAFHNKLSFDSIYRRYFSIHPELSQHEVAHLTEVDYLDRLAFVVEDGDDLVAVGRYDREPSTTIAEVAFVVRDDYQHVGIGRRLLEALADAARERGITTFTAETMFENRNMMSVFRQSKFPVTSSVSDGLINVRFSIEPTNEPSTARDEHAGETK
jgi:GNAT superfamily N-acetyltransferase